MVFKTKTTAPENVTLSNEQDKAVENYLIANLPEPDEYKIYQTATEFVVVWPTIELANKWIEFIKSMHPEIECVIVE